MKKLCVNWIIVILAAAILTTFCGCQQDVQAAEATPHQYIDVKLYPQPSAYSEYEQEQGESLSSETKAYIRTVDGACNTSNTSVILTDGAGWLLSTDYTSGSANYLGEFVGNTQTVLKRVTANPDDTIYIDLEPYTTKKIKVLQSTFPAKSELGKQMAEEFYTAVEPVEGQGYRLDAMICDDEGRVYLAGNCEDLLIFDSDGEFLGAIEVYTEKFSASYRFAKATDGRIILISYEGLPFDRNYRIVDAETMAVSDEIYGRVKAANSGLLPSFIDGYDVIEYSKDGIFAFNLDSKESLPLATFESLGIAYENLSVRDAGTLEDGGFAMEYYDWTDRQGMAMFAVFTPR